MVIFSTFPLGMSMNDMEIVGLKWQRRKKKPTIQFFCPPKYFDDKFVGSSDHSSIHQSLTKSARLVWNIGGEAAWFSCLKSSISCPESSIWKASPQFAQLCSEIKEDGESSCFLTKSLILDYFWGGLFTSWGAWGDFTHSRMMAPLGIHT